MPETEERSIEQQLSDVETLLRDLPGRVATILASRWPEVVVDVHETHDARPGERAPINESHDLIMDALKPLTLRVQAELDALRAKINTRPSTSQRTLVPTEQPKQAAPNVTTHRAEHLQTSSQPTSPGRDNSKIRIAPEDMGPHMPSTLEKLTTAHGFDQLFEVTPLPIPLAADLSEVFTLEGDPDVKANEFMAAGDGATHVLVADVEDGVDFQWPDFATVVERPTLEEATQFLESTIRAPPTTAPHFGGTFQHTLKNESPLHPGNELASLTQLTHANEEYAHIGARYSTTCMHKEDAGFISCNIVDAGYKIWLLPDIGQNDIFEKAIRADFGGNRCDQWVRHLSLAITPTWLKARGIRYRIMMQGPGQMNVTEPEQYHQVTNYSSCVARSINAIPPGQEMATRVGSGIVACCNCGLWPLRTLKGHIIMEVEPLEEHYFHRDPEPESSDDNDDDDVSEPPRRSGPGARACTKRKAIGELAYRPSKRARSAVHEDTPEAPLKVGACRAKMHGVHKVASNDEEPSSDTDGPADNMAEALDRLVVMPGAQPDGDITDDVFRMAAAICSRDALKQFIDMVSYWSGHTPFAHAVSEAIVPEGTNPDTRALVQRCIQVKHGEKRGGSEQVLARYNDLQLARVYRRLRGDAGRIDSESLEMVMSACKMNKYVVRYHQKAGNKWDRVCGKLEYGLLAFIPYRPKKASLFGVNTDMYQALGLLYRGDDLARLHQLIDCKYVQKICQVAKAWFNAIDGNKSITFKWAERDVDWDSLDEQGVLEEFQIDVLE
ncbi:hypothetical protein LRP88_07379 [Fusarium phalaenopsidis]